MTVTFAVMGQAKPGRWDDAVRDAAHAGKIYERHGIDRVRFSTTAIAGEAEGQWVFSLEFPSGAAYGAAQDRVMADEEMQALLHSTRAADSAVTVLSSVLMVEIPTKAGPGTTGPVTEAHLSRLNPGGLARMLATTEEAFEIARSHGAVGTRLFRMTYAGSMTGLYAVIFEYPDVATFSAGLDKWGSDAKSKALMEGIDAADAPTTLISSAVYTDIPL
jgi:hypothetical protein